VEVCVESDPRQLSGARAWLAGLIDVLAVRIHDAEPKVLPTSG
jgi:hypothetical protein